MENIDRIYKGSGVKGITVPAGYHMAQMESGVAKRERVGVSDRTVPGQNHMDEMSLTLSAIEKSRLGII